MTKIFVDTNVILDLLMKRNDYADAITILNMGQNPNNELVVSVLSMANIAYVLRKVLSGDALYSALSDLSGFVTVATVSSDDYGRALEQKAKDFEDALQYFCAKSYKCSCIVTRNKKDFMFADDIPVLSPKEFLK